MRTFWFELPLNTEPGNITLHPQEYLNTLLAPTQETESIPKQQEENKTAPNHTLLVVDDNKDLTDYLATALKDRFKTIWVAADGEEALRLCRKKRPHIVVISCLPENVFLCKIECSWTASYSKGN